MNNPDVKNSKFGYAHPLVGSDVLMPVSGRQMQDLWGVIVRVQEPVGLGKHRDTQTNIAVKDAESPNEELYSPLDEVEFLDK